ncbi:hypothetical protein GCM10009853_055630 [Glycomyces scopariae]
MRDLTGVGTSGTAEAGEAADSDSANAAAATPMAVKILFNTMITPLVNLVLDCAL